MKPFFLAAVLIVASLAASAGHAAGDKPAAGRAKPGTLASLWFRCPTARTCRILTRCGASVPNGNRPKRRPRQPAMRLRPGTHERWPNG